MAKRLRRKIDNIDTSIKLEDGKKEYINQCIVNNRSKYTIKTYELHWELFMTFLNKKYKDEQIIYTYQIEKKMLTDFILFLREKSPNISDATVNCKIRSVRAILYYFMDNNYLEQFQIKEVTEHIKEKVPFTKEEQIKLLYPPKENETFEQYRNWVITFHIFSTANRSRTVRNIKMKDVSFEKRLIRLEETKNNEQYEVPINRDYFPILYEYYQERLSQGATSEDYLFCTTYGKKFTADGLRSSMYKYIKSRGVENTSLHLIRHTFATEWILNDGSVEKLREILGHKSDVIIKKYLHICGKDLINDIDEFAPVSKLREDLTPKRKFRRCKK